MKNLVILLAIFTLAATGCEKEDTRPACEQNGTAIITLKCTSSNPYAIYQNDVFKQVANPNSTSTITVKAGAQEIKAVQKSGYVFVPTEKTFSREVVACEDMEFSFP